MYSLFFSTIVEPRTVRAYCTQLAAPIAKIRTKIATLECASRGSTARATPSISKRDQNGRKRELDVGDAHDERIELAADVA